MSRIRLAVVGAGAWGSNHVRVIVAEPRCELVAVSDPNHGARNRAARLAPGATLYEDVSSMLGDATIDGVVIATPAPTHAALACQALARGKHVLVEKPVALSSEDTLGIQAAAKDRVVLVGHLMVFHPALVRLREMLRSGELGSLHYMHSIRANLGKIRRDENALWSFGPHELSMMEFLLGRSPVSVTARGLRIVQPGVEDVVFVTMRYASGEMANLHLSWLHPRKERRLTLVCSRKMVEFDDVAPEKLRIYDRGYERPPEFTQFSEYLTIRDGEVHIPQLTMEEPLVLQLRHFLDCIQHGVEPRSNLVTGLRIVRTLEAAQRSMAMDGLPVDLTQSGA